ncbi:uncharacterized protein BT62DRAFT_689192 [Guyanagaster necrorhizus]|uniref:Uncharacterized protein n=1 Tax=Guyanagaster necrorhizus TaxID=856835 RepID=A0A9P7VFX8_9AGAR|nr:uncharacterized protein BT62DRAFT_689192 [Guyanagaster necrorhizus MCA 3950]KAG7439825.1 hypothetical protein BT62DRAFT_689192 [Guyanagaster necrorhizus MCA 3950]
MDAPLNPPTRIQPFSVTSISTKSTQKRIDAFMSEFQARTTAAQGINTAVTVQLQNLRDALREEHERRKK